MKSHRGPLMLSSGYVVLVHLLLILCTGCYPTAHAGQDPIRLDQIRSMTIHGLSMVEGNVTLSSGRWEGAPYVKGGSSKPIVRLVEDILLSGDVTGDASDDAVVFVVESGGGTGSIVDMLVVEHKGNAVKNRATVRLGDRVQIRSARLDRGVITLELVQHSDTDPMCCPGDLVTHSWVWAKDALAKREEVHTGRLGPNVLAGETWRLVAWNSQELVPVNSEITLAYDKGNILGSAGCNRYFSSVTTSEIPGDIKLENGGSTRMLCPPAIMAQEDRYLAILSTVNHIGFSYGRLYLSYLKDGTSGVLLFKREH